MLKYDLIPHKNIPEISLITCYVIGATEQRVG